MAQFLRFFFVYCYVCLVFFWGGNFVTGKIYYPSSPFSHKFWMHIANKLLTCSDKFTIHSFLDDSLSCHYNIKTSFDRVSTHIRAKQFSFCSAFMRTPIQKTTNSDIKHTPKSLYKKYYYHHSQLSMGTHRMHICTGSSVQ